MRVKRRCSTRWGHPYHRPGACATCRQARLRPLCFIPSMIPKRYMEWSAQSTAEDPSEGRKRVRNVDLTVRDGEKGPVHIEMIKRRVQTRMERKRLGPEE